MGRHFEFGNRGEWKKGQRILYEHNIFEKFGYDDRTQQVNTQYALLFAASNGNGTAGDVNPWDFVGDVTIPITSFGMSLLALELRAGLSWTLPTIRKCLHGSMFTII